MNDQAPRRDSGVAALLVVIAAVPILVGSAALGIDLARLLAVGQSLQRTADAAALAGVVYLPADVPGARAEARRVADANADTSQSVSVEPVPERPSRLQVTVTTTVAHAFAGLLGVPPTAVTRQAIADYAAPLALGSPCNVFGREDMPAAGGGAGQQPVGTTACEGVGRFWAGASGPAIDKMFGDAFATNWCVWPTGARPTAECDPGGAGPNPPGRNLQYRPDGATYVVRVSRPGTLHVQVFDPVWGSTGGQCRGVTDPADQSRLVDPLLGADRVLSNEFVDVLPSTTNPRYADVPSPYCTGDDQQPYPYADPSPTALSMTTSFELRAAGMAPGSIGPAVCPALTSPGVDALTSNYSQILTAGVGGEAGLRVRQMFHRWVAVCPGVTVTPGDYSVHVSTSAGSGNNRFALRAWIDGVDGGVTVWARERMQVFSNITAGTTLFHLVRLDSSVAGRVLQISAFDLGDAAQPMRVEVLAPDAQTPIVDCVVSGASVDSGPGCAMTAQYDVTNGQWTNFTAPIPASYRCAADTDPAACWVRVRITSPADVYDTTTWVARMAGDPVRIVR